MTVIQYSVLILIGLASGFAVASGIFAFITMLGIIPRLAARTNTANHVVWYETMIIAGGALGNIWIVFEIPMPLTSIFLAVYGLFAGVYVGCTLPAGADQYDGLGSSLASHESNRHRVGQETRKSWLCPALRQYA